MQTWRSISNELTHCLLLHLAYPSTCTLGIPDKGLSSSSRNIAKIAGVVLEIWNAVRDRAKEFCQLLDPGFPLCQPEIPTEIMMSGAQPMKADVTDQSLKESIVMSFYLLPPVNHHKLTDLFFIRNCNDRLWLAKQTTSLAKQNAWNVEIANLPAKDYTLLNVNVSASIQFIDFKLWEVVCIVFLYVHAEF